MTALPICDPCCNIPGNISDAKFKQDIEVIACGILAALTGGGSSGVLLGLPTTATPSRPALVQNTPNTILAANPLRKRNAGFRNTSGVTVYVTEDGSAPTVNSMPVFDGEFYFIFSTGAIKVLQTASVPNVFINVAEVQ